MGLDWLWEFKKRAAFGRSQILQTEGYSGWAEESPGSRLRSVRGVAASGWRWRTNTLVPDKVAMRVTPHRAARQGGKRMLAEPVVESKLKSSGKKLDGGRRGRARRKGEERMPRQIRVEKARKSRSSRRLSVGIATGSAQISILSFQVQSKTESR